MIHDGVMQEEKYSVCCSSNKERCCCWFVGVKARVLTLLGGTNDDARGVHGLINVVDGKMGKEVCQCASLCGGEGCGEGGKLCIPH